MLPEKLEEKNYQLKNFHEYKSNFTAYSKNTTAGSKERPFGQMPIESLGRLFLPSKEIDHNCMRIKKIYVAEDIPNGEPEAEKETLNYGLLNTDVIVQLKDGGSYKANFITLKKLVSEFQARQDKVENLSKKYFWSKNMVVINDMEKKELRPIIEYMIEEGDFQVIFEKLS